MSGRWHDCRSTLCVTPHGENDGHADDCLCELCHDHNWQEWTVYPECEGCLIEMAAWIHENTDFVGCPLPDVCTYSDHCDEQYQIEMYGQIVRKPRRR